jgi:hypothetical protein
MGERKHEFDTLMDNTENIFLVYNFNKKIRCGPNNDGGYVIGDLDTKYDCLISAGISNNDDFSVDFIEKYKMNVNNSFGFDGTVENMPQNLINKMTFIKKNIGYINDDKTTNLDYLFEKYSNIFVKMDIEGGEWSWLIFMDETRLSKISQLVIEIHGITNTSWHGMTVNSFNCSYDEKLSCLKKIGTNTLFNSCSWE